MSNSLITPTIIAKEALVQLENNLVMGNLVHREYKEEFVKVGSSVNIRKPVKFVTSDGATASIQDVEEKNTSITIDQRKHVAWKFSTQDLTLTVEEYSERYIKPAMITLAQTMDQAVHGLYSTVWNSVGTPGTTPGTFLEFGAVSQRLTEMAVAEPRMLTVNPAAGLKIADQLKGLPNEGMAKGAFEEAHVGRIARLKAYETQNVKNHTTGARGGTPLVNGASQNTTYASSGAANSQSLITDGWSNSVTNVVKAGDVFTIAGVYAVNPVPGESKDTLPYLQQFVVLANADSNGSGQATLTISPAIITSGPFQTVSAAPADNAALTFFASASTAYPQMLGFHKNAFALVTVPLEMPDGAAFKARETANGLSVRVIKDYDFTNDEDRIRIDVLYGKKAIYPDLACRLWG